MSKLPGKLAKISPVCMTPLAVVAQTLQSQQLSGDIDAKALGIVNRCYAPLGAGR